jgi:hypothetical protein
MSAGMVNQSNPLTRKKRKPQNPSLLIQLFIFEVFTEVNVSRKFSSSKKSAEAATKNYLGCQFYYCTLPPAQRGLRCGGNGFRNHHGTS